MAQPNFRTAQLQDYFLAGAGAVIGATSIILKSMLDIDGNALSMATDFGTIGYGTLEPGNGTLEEQISFSGLTNNSNGTVTLTGVKTVSFVYPYTETSGLAKTHAGSTTFVISNTSGFYNQFPAKQNDETITGQWTFSTFPITPSNSDASTTVKGVTKLSTAPVSATSPIAVGDNDNRLLNIPVGYAVDSVGTDAYAITPTPAITAYTAGNIFTFKAGTANTGAATLNVSGLGAKTIKKFTSAGSSDLVTGDILVGQVVLCEYDGTNMQVLSQTPNTASAPITNTYTTASSTIGSSTTRFDITNTSGTTYRYTFDGTGTDPSISLANNPIGSLINFQAQNFNANNNGVFVVTGAGTNYVEVTNASGVAENDKTIGTGYVVKSGTSVWTKPTGLKYITVEVVGGGGGGGGASNLSGQSGGGGGGGGYAKKTISASSLSSTEYYIVGVGGTAGASGSGGTGYISSFSSYLLATGGTGGGSSATGGVGGIGSLGDLNIKGGGGSGGDVSNNTGSTGVSGGSGGSSVLGGGANSVANNTSPNAGGVYGGGGGGGSTVKGGGAQDGAVGAQGIVIVTEYYI